MIAQVVFDLPLDGPFDYLIPPNLADKITVGMRVKVSFCAKLRIGVVVGLLSHSAIPKLKSIQASLDASAVFNALDLAFAQDFCAYYGCGLGEALFTMHRSQEVFHSSLRREAKPRVSLYRCSVGRYAAKVREIALAAGQPDLVKLAEERLALYRAGKAYRSAAPPQSPP